MSADDSRIKRGMTETRTSTIVTCYQNGTFMIERPDKRTTFCIDAAQVRKHLGDTPKNTVERRYENAGWK